MSHDTPMYGYGLSDFIDNNRSDPLTPVDEHALLDEFKTAAQEFVDAADAGAELDRFVKWFKALLA